MGKSSFDAYQDYILWEQALNSLKEDLATDAVQSAFQTSEYWKQVFMEIVGKWQRPIPLWRLPFWGSFAAPKILHF